MEDWKVAVMAYLNIMSQYLPIDTGDYHRQIFIHAKFHYPVTPTSEVRTDVMKVLSLVVY